MKNICTINTALPSVDEYIDYLSDSSLLDYDIAVFDPKLPYLHRIEFNDGGSCVTIEGSKRLKQAIDHWSKELRDALSSGKTVFVILNSFETDSLSSGSSSPRKGSISYNTYTVNNYSVLPVNIDLRNAKGRRIKIVEAGFKGLHEVIKEVAEYRVIVLSELNKKIFVTNDGNGVVGGVMSFDEMPGNLVFLPHFELSDMVEIGEDGEVWSDEAISISKKIVGQLVEIDRTLRREAGSTPKPEWMESVQLPEKVAEINKAIKRTENEISKLEQRKAKEIEKKTEFEEYTALLYESGKILESAIENSLKLMGYKVENFRKGDLEIDHVIVGPSGLRMIGESEGKDNSAIGISKFRQLESNINEDFDREDAEAPAKGVLFGNGYRLTEPDKRKDEFTEKCLINAKRLGTALVRTTDLYRVVLYILDNPKDGKFKENCRQALETTRGDFVEFPT